MCYQGALGTVRRTRVCTREVPPPRWRRAPTADGAGRDARGRRGSRWGPAAGSLGLGGSDPHHLRGEG
jgi:hypothetical protein